tara:strand:+ start:588 stop:773 length:186 start_codon:yes stop_codon:yes gene_type:complete
MTYSVHSTIEDKIIYITSNNKVTCIDTNPEFQSWLRDNQDTLPDDIQAKIDAGELTIADAD